MLECIYENLILRNTFWEKSKCVENTYKFVTIKYAEYIDFDFKIWFCEENLWGEKSRFAKINKYVCFNMKGENIDVHIEI